MNKKHCPICGRFIDHHKSYCYDPECVLKASERVLGVKFERININPSMVEIRVIRNE